MRPHRPGHHRYLKDRGIKGGLVRLLDSYRKSRGLTWIRLMYLYPTGIHDDLLKS